MALRVSSALAQSATNLLYRAVVSAPVCNAVPVTAAGILGYGRDAQFKRMSALPQLAPPSTLQKQRHMSFCWPSRLDTIERPAVLVSAREPTDEGERKQVAKCGFGLELGLILGFVGLLGYFEHKEQMAKIASITRVATDEIDSASRPQTEKEHMLKNAEEDFLVGSRYAGRFLEHFKDERVSYLINEKGVVAGTFKKASLDLSDNVRLLGSPTFSMTVDSKVPETVTEVRLRDKEIVATLQDGSVRKIAAFPYPADNQDNKNAELCPAKVVFAAPADKPFIFYDGTRPLEGHALRVAQLSF